MKNKILVGFLSVLVGLSLSLGITAHAAESDSGKSWKFDLAPFYLWGVNLEGDVTLGTPVGSATQPIDVPFDDVFSNLEAAFIFHFEGMKDNRWGFLVDYNYLDISGEQSLPLNSTLSVDLKTTLVELAGIYRIAGAPQHHFDFLVGARYMDIEPAVALSGPINLGVDASQDWVDPFVGLRWNWHFAEKWHAIVRGDVGGFGVGSDIAWQGAALLYWQPWKHVGFIGGYRGLYQDYEDGSGQDLFKFDVTIHGPVIGLNITW